MASGAIAGHLIATTIAILGGAFLANYISEKLVGYKFFSFIMFFFFQACILISIRSTRICFQVGYLGGALFLVFSIATFFGVF